MRPGDWIEIVALVVVFAMAFLGLAYHIQKPSRTVGGRMSKRVASGLVVRRILRGSDHLWN
jgi:archaellin